MTTAYEVPVKGIFAVGLIGGALSVAAIMAPAESVQAWGPFAMLSTVVGVFTAWLVDRDEYRAPAATAKKRAA